MPTPTHTLIEAVTLATSASSVTFSSIPQTYGDLVLALNIKPTAALNVRLRVNGDTGTNYNYVVMAGNGTAASSASAASQDFIYLDYTAYTNITASVIQANFIDYSTDKHKSILARASNSTTGVNAQGIRWASAAAITSMEIYAISNQFDVGSTFHLYGIAKAL